MWLLGGIVLVGAIARFATLDLQSLDHDEAVTAVKVLQPGLLGTLDAVVDNERSPPLYYLLVWGWSNLFGTGEIGLRSLSALLGTAVVPVAYATARELTTRRAGLIAGALVALNPQLIWYSQEARSYALMVLLTTLSLLFFVRALSDRDDRSLVLWAGSAALALTAHYFAVFVVVPQAIWLLAIHRHRLRMAFALAAVAVVGAGLLPLALVQEGEGRRSVFTETPLVERVGEVGMDFVAGEEPNPLAGDLRVDSLQLAAALVGLALVVIAVHAAVRGRDPAVRRGVVVVGSVGLAAVVVPLLMAAGGMDFFNPRNLVGAIVPLLVAIGVGLASEQRLGVVAAATGVILFGAVVVAAATSEQMQRPNWRAASETIRQEVGPTVIVAPHIGDDPLRYYLNAEELAAGSRVEVARIDALGTHFRDVRRPAGFRLDDQIRMEPLFMLWRYRSAKPRTIVADDVADRRVLSERSVVLLRR